MWFSPIQAPSHFQYVEKNESLKRKGKDSDLSNKEST
jgi:hypothetical protein